MRTETIEVHDLHEGVKPIAHRLLRIGDFFLGGEGQIERYSGIVATGLVVKPAEGYEFFLKEGTPHWLVRKVKKVVRLEFEMPEDFKEIVRVVYNDLQDNLRVRSTDLTVKIVHSGK